MAGWGKCVEGGVEVSLGGWCVGGAGEQDGLGEREDQWKRKIT